MISEEANTSFDYDYYRDCRDRSIGRLMWQMKRLIGSFVEPRLHELGFADFKLSYLPLLSNLDENGITNSELAKRAYVTKQMMSKTVSLLEASGYIYTTKNEHDSRSSMIFLNERGKALFVALSQCMQELRSKFDQIAGSERVEQMVDTLAILVNELYPEKREITRS